MCPSSAKRAKKIAIERRWWGFALISVLLLQPTNLAGDPAWCHAEADPTQLHQQRGLRPGAHGPVRHTQPRLAERLPRWLRERGRPAEAHRWSRGRRRSARGRTPQAGPGHLHCHVPTALPASAAHCVLHQLSATELFLRLHAV